MTIKNHKFLMIIGTTFFILAAMTALGIYKTRAAVENSSCIIQDLGVQSGNTPGGYNYRTIKVTQPGDGSDVGNLLTGSCQLTYANLAHGWAGQTRHADAVWEGTRSDKASYNPAIDGGRRCTAQPPSPQIGVDRCSSNTRGTYWVYQDDAGAVSIGGSMVYCVAISTICPTPSIYARGAEPNPNAFRGAGYNQPGASPNLTGLFNKTPANDPSVGGGYLDNTTFRMWSENTWSGGYTTVMVLTLRYPPVDQPPIISINTSCNNHNFSATSGDPDYTGNNNGNYSVQYSIEDAAAPGTVIDSGDMPTPWAGVVSVKTHTHNMAALNQSRTYKITVSTTGISFPGITGPRVSAIGTYACPGGARTISCGNLSTAPILVPPSTPFDVTLRANYTGATPPTPNTFTVITSGPPPVTSPGLGLTEVVGSKTQSGGVAADTFHSAGVPAGSYSVVWNFNSALGNALSCPGTILVANILRPYLGIYGGDVFAGGGFDSIDSSCSNAGSITTYVRPDNAGSGSQFAAFVMNDIAASTGQGFATAQLTSPPNGPPTGLLFANTSPLGHFTNQNCISYTPASGTPNLPPSCTAANCDISSWPPGIYYANSNLTLNDPGNSPMKINNGTQITLYVTGNLTIMDNIEYKGTTWRNMGDIPSIKIVVQGGNIYIDDSVTQLDGIFEAAPDSSSNKGIIYTCTNSSALWPTDQLYGNCGGAPGPPKQLTINGKLIAQDIKWLRTYGDITNTATVGENPYTGTSHAAEIVIDGPEDYITPNAASGCKITCRYDYITSLPPIL